jgi:DNA repair exonuclease SbcCD ATPase subunit
MKEQIEKIKREADMAAIKGVFMPADSEIRTLLTYITDLEKQYEHAHKLWADDAEYYREKIKQLEKQVAELEGENTDLNDRCEDIKNETLEEAAKVTNSFKYKFPTEPKQITTNVVCEDIIIAIRALKQKDKS